NTRKWTHEDPSNGPRHLRPRICPRTHLQGTRRQGVCRYGQLRGRRRCENGVGPAGRASGGGVTMKAAQKGTQKSAKSTTAIGKTSKGFTEEERGAMTERAQEPKAAARSGAREENADGD